MRKAVEFAQKAYSIGSSEFNPLDADAEEDADDAHDDKQQALGSPECHPQPVAQVSQLH